MLDAKEKYWLLMKKAPRSFFQEAASEIAEAHHVAFKTGEALGLRAQFELRNYFPNAVGSLIESKLAELARKFNIPEETGFNGNQTYSHVKLELPGIYLTQSRIWKRGQIVRESDFREDYQDKYQLSFLDEERKTKIRSNGYGILLSGPAEDDRFDLGFVDLYFPADGVTIDVFEWIMKEEGASIYEVDRAVPSFPAKARLKKVVKEENRES